MKKEKAETKAQKAVSINILPKKQNKKEKGLPIGKEMKQLIAQESFGSFDYPVIGYLDSEDWSFRKLEATRKDIPQFAHYRQ